MKMWIWDTAFISVWLVNGKVHYHATAYKMLGEESSCKGDIFFLGKFVLKGNIEAVGELCFLSFLHFLNGVP